MGYVIEISEDKLESLSEHIEKGLRHLGKAMQCVDEWSRGNPGERDRYGRGYGERGYGERDDEGWENDDRMGERGGYGNRRGVPGTGRYSRYR